MRRISILILLVFFSCSSPVLAARHHKPRLTKAEAHKATELRLAMLQKEWAEVITGYTVAPATTCRRRSGEDMTCSYKLTNEPEGFSAPIVCSGNAKLHLNHGNRKAVNVDVTLGPCESSGSGGWTPKWDL